MVTLYYHADDILIYSCSSLSNLVDINSIFIYDGHDVCDMSLSICISYSHMDYHVLIKGKLSVSVDV